MTDYYGILGLTEGATKDDVNKAYRKMAKRYHPDSPNGDKNMFELITVAKEKLLSSLREPKVVGAEDVRRRMRKKFEQEEEIKQQKRRLKDIQKQINLLLQAVKEWNLIGIQVCDGFGNIIGEISDKKAGEKRKGKEDLERYSIVNEKGKKEWHSIYYLLVTYELSGLTPDQQDVCNKLKKLHKMKGSVW